MLEVLFYTFLLFLIVQFYFFGFLFLKFGFHKPIEPSLKKIAISVLVCAKNEGENLKSFIPKILAQDYLEFELVLINDNSTDHTLEVMKSFEASYENVRVVDVKPVEHFWNNKKYALTLGIKAASHDFLLLTDGDCMPRSDQWIKSMSRHFTNKKTIVLGYGAYKKIRGSLLNMLIRFETLLTAIQYFSYAIAGSPYMGVGRNLAYRKDEFFKSDGFKSHLNIPSGDDDLFINQVANNENTSINYLREATTESLPSKHFSQWFHQKRRHVTAVNHYKWKHKSMLGIFYLSQILFWALSFILLITGHKISLVLSFFLIRILFVSFSYSLAARKLKELDLIWIWPFLELFLILGQLVIFISNLTSKTHRWR